MSTLKIHNFHIHILYKLASNRNTELKEVTKFETAERIYEYQATTAKSILSMGKAKKKMPTVPYSSRNLLNYGRTI